MRARCPETLVVRPQDDVARSDPLVEQRVRERNVAGGVVARPVERRRARIAEAGGPVRPRDDGPAVLRRLALRDRDGPGHRDRTPVECGRPVQDQEVARRRRKPRARRERTPADQVARPASRKMARRLVEGSPRRPPLDRICGAGHSDRKRGCEHKRQVAA